MSRYSHNTAAAVREESFPSPEQVQPIRKASKQSLPSLEEVARDILLNSGERGKWWTARLEVSKTTISGWMRGDKISEANCFEIRRLYKTEIRFKARSLEDRVTAWEDNVLWAKYGPNYSEVES